MKLSTTIITLNEEKDLPRCLESVRDISDQIVVVDCGSTDNTVKIAKSFGAEVYTRVFDNYADQKNFAIKKADGEWILSLDADEEISPALAKEIDLVTRNGQSEIAGYSIPRKNIIFGKLIRYTRWQSELDRHVWLWKKNKGSWEGDVHEEVVVNGRVGKLVNAKIHYQYENVTEFMTMMNRYSEFDANQNVKNGVKFSYIRVFFDPVYNFLVRYLYRLGFLDGWRGFILSYLMAIYHIEIAVKMWERKGVNRSVV